MKLIKSLHEASFTQPVCGDAVKSDFEAAEQLKNPQLRCDRLVGSSKGTEAVYQLIHRVANLSVFVLITGESGTGKELVARGIHNVGSRSGRPFIPVSCGAIPESLIEAELFGHEKGAFTDAINSRPGCLEQAADGTLLLDEIGELSLSTQVKLLRVLQEKKFTRLGCNKTIPLRARVLFATHRNLQDMVQAGTFRQDLFFRVNVVKIEIPPLRERPEDIPLLARHFLARYAEEYGKPVSAIGPEAMQALVEYDWPGNIRELENVIQRAVILADEDTIGLAELPGEITEPLAGSPQELESDSLPNGSFEKMLHEYKVKLAKLAVAECNGNKSQAARKLQLSRAYLHRLIRPGPQLVSAA